MQNQLIMSELGRTNGKQLRFLSFEWSFIKLLIQNQLIMSELGRTSGK